MQGSQAEQWTVFAEKTCLKVNSYSFNIVNQLYTIFLTNP